MHKYHRLPLSALLSGAILCFTLTANAAEPAASPVDRLNDWLGTWKFDSTKLDTKYSHAGTETGETTCAWQSSHGYMICESVGDDIDPAQGIKPDNLSIFYYMTADKTLRHTFMEHDDGGTMLGTTTIDGNTWTVISQIPRRSGGTADLRDTYVFVTPAKRTMKTEISIDNGAHWTEISHTVLTKV